MKNVPTNLSNLKSKAVKLDLGKLETTKVDLSKLSYAVKTDVVTKTENDELVKEVDNISTTDTSDFVKKTDCSTKINEIEKKLLIIVMMNILLLKNFIN